MFNTIIMKFPRLSSLKKYKLPKTKSGRKIGYALVLLALLIVIGLFSNYLLLSRSVELPKITKPDELTNAQLVFTAPRLFGVTIDDQELSAEKIDESSYRIIYTPTNSGTLNYTAYGIKKNRLFNVRSKDTSTGTVTVDLDPPQISEVKLEPLYTEPEAAFTFLIDEASTITISDQEASCTTSDVVNCPLVFTEEGKQSITLTAIDLAGNSSTTPLTTVYTTKPELICNESELPPATTQQTVSVTCTTNKEGVVIAQSKEYDPIPGTPFQIDYDLPEEGTNKIFAEFTDTYDLNTTIERDIVKDTTAPTANFTFLDSKKVYQQGEISIGFAASEDAQAEVTIRPANNLFETDGLAQELIKSGKFAYEGGQTFAVALTGGQSQTFSTPNNLAICNILSSTNKNCFSPAIAAIEVTLTDALGNSRNYTCNNWIATDTAQLDGLESTACTEV